MSNILRLLAALLGLFFFDFNLTAQAVDTMPPELKCKPMFNLSVCNPWGGYITIYALDFVESVTDDISSASNITLGIRKKCTGDGFPTDKTYLFFTMAEVGTGAVEIWAKDQAGNTTFCQSAVYLVDNAGYCDPGVSGRVYFPKDSSSVKKVRLDIDRFGCQGDTAHEQLPPLPFYFGGSLSRPGDLLWATPSKTDHPLNGISTYDIFLISRHILGLSKLSAAQLIAADANRDGKVTTYDIVLLRQLILGIIPELPGGVSWRFWPYDYPFPDPDNPFDPPFPERIEVPRSADPATNNFWFFGVKIGDVNFSAELK